MNWIDSVSTTLLNKDLDGLWTRQQAISDNIANFETPGYKAKSVSFEDELKAQLSAADPGNSQDGAIERLQGVNPVVSEASDQTFRADGNGVDLEQQNIEMARTSMNYSYSLQALSDMFTRLHTAITGSSK